MKFNKKTIIRFVLLAIGAFVVGVNLYSLNAAKLTGNQVPMPFGFGSSVVLSGSMEPELYTGDLIFIKETNDYEVGDVVVFQSGNIPTVHRIIKIEDNKVTTKGDNNNTADEELIFIWQIKGEVVGRIPLVGYLVNVIKKPVTTVCLIIFMFWMLEKSYRKEKDKKNEELDLIKEEIRRLREESKEDVE